MPITPDTPVAALTRAKPQAPTALLTSAPVQIVRFGVRVAGFGLLLAPHRPAEVLAKPPIYRLTHSPAWLAGLFPLRGHLLPVIDLHPVLTASASHDSGRFLLVLGQREQGVGVLIDALPFTLALPAPLAQLPPLPTELAPHVSHAYEAASGLWLDWQDHTFLQQLASTATGGARPFIPA